MSFDSSRFTFNPWNDFSAVVMQQGRVQLDSEWNEWLAELARRIQAGSYDTLGQAVYPATTPTAFQILPNAAGTSITIGVGRMYVDGLLVENHGLTAPAFQGWVPTSTTSPAGTNGTWDPALAELFFNSPVDYASQPYYPNVSVVAPFPSSGGPYLIYLDIWQRELTFLEDPDLIEKAVGIDTTARLQTVWQVKWLDVSQVNKGNVNCTTSNADLNWPPPPSAGRLTTGVVQSIPSGPCCLTPNTGYTGLENQLYRVEIHQLASGSTPATFKWSRDDACIATAVAAISPDNTVLTVQSTGKDNVLHFAVNDWVELTDDWLELNGQAGELHQVKVVDNTAQTITLTTAVTGSFNPSDLTRHTRAIRWNDANINVPVPGTTVTLEDGITVVFDLIPNTGSFNVGDFWTFAARTADGTVESLVDVPARGVHHHYARLAVLTFPLSSDNPPSDCRVPWPPSGEGCDCASCVTADSHNNNTFTIQQAINAVLAEGGGKVCLGPGVYNIATPITIGDPNTPAQNLAICGHGLPTLVPTAQFDGTSIMLIQNAIDIDVDYLTFSYGPSTVGDGFAITGLTIEGSSYVRVERCVFGLSTDINPLFRAIALAGPALLACTLRENLFINVRVGVRMADQDGLLLTQFKMEDNQMFCSDAAVFLDNPETLIASEIRFAANFVESFSGFTLLGNGLDAAVEDNTFSTFPAVSAEGEPSGVAVACSLSQTRIANNEIVWNAIPLSVTVTANNTGGLTAGDYKWVVTALDAQGRERIFTSFSIATVAAPSNATLTWSAMAGVTGYNIYRTVVNGVSLLLGGSLPQSSSPTVSYTDNVTDGNLQAQQLPVMQNDGIVIGAPSSATAVYGTQVSANRIAGLTGTGITTSSFNTSLFETTIAHNHLLKLGGNGISLLGPVSDVDIIENSLLSVGKLSLSVDLYAIELHNCKSANIIENTIEELGPDSLATGAIFAIFVEGSGGGTRIAGNRIASNGLSTTPSGGITAGVFGLLHVANNQVLRSPYTVGFAGKDEPPVSIARAPTQPNLWSALTAVGYTVSAEGNLLESYFGKPASPRTGTGQPPLPSTADILALLSCNFSNNQCYLDWPDPQATVVSVQSLSESIIAIGNRVTGPNLRTQKENSPPSMNLLAPTLVGTSIPAVTAIGNITSMGIDVPPGMPAAMTPLNVIV